MLRSLDVAKVGMSAQQTRVEIISNNLANASTHGFKRILTSFEELGPPIPGGGGLNTPLPGLQSGLGRGRLPNPAVRGPGAPIGLVTRTGVDPRTGPILATGNPLDFAVEGDGFFVVKTPAGERYTRDGSFHLDEEGGLVNDMGHPILGAGGPIEIPPGDIQVASDGAITVDGELLGQIKLVSLPFGEGVVHEAGNLFRIEGGGRAEAMEAESIRLSQGFLEGSNANPIQDLVALIAAQRIYEAGQRVLVTTDETLGRTINDVGRIG